MKEINGKIKFGVIGVTVKTDKNITVDTEDFMSLSEEQTIDMVLLSDITEEQASEFVNTVSFDGVSEEGVPYVRGLSFKESLVHLLKENDVWIKEWSSEPKRITTNALSEKNKDRVLKIRERLYSNLPDDLLIIKL